MTLNLDTPYDHAFEKALVDKMVQRLGDKVS
jgi:hypothetical protein